ncbi:MAG TPA: heparan-alpha-glucosaminide N-acetyltransferase domain-containing protein [Polyangium sp.]|nr:heparan-alpha-glucosaminide N-acetyltransferase domain-containing protein [Polyangium sp.]
MTIPVIAEQAAGMNVAPVNQRKASRIDSIDALRGFVMILMAIDHVRDFIGPHVAFRGIDVVKAGAPLFLTRWITHFCAPVFVLLAGTGAYFQTAHGKSPQELSKFLFTRGLWLVFLEITVIRLGWFFNVSYKMTALQVIWAIGWSMVALAAIVRLPIRFVGAFGVAMILLHNVFDGVSLDNPLWSVLHVSKMLKLDADHAVFVVYPLIPWVGVMAAGFALGAFVDVDAETRRRRFLRLGAACTLAFVVLRALNVYGDPLPREHYDSALHTILSFLNCTKYPPSLAYLLMTLGPALVALGLMERNDYPGKRILLVFGRAPLFYYVLHLYLIHAGSIALFVSVYGVQKSLSSLQQFGMPEEMLFGLPVVYAGTALVVVLLYPLCRWFAELKRRRRDLWWLGYL